MKAKTIEKVLNKKINEWISTIKDPAVAYLAKKNTIVTGGSIASMLLNEKVNDFDIYFRNRETVIAIAKYYGKNTDGKVILDTSDPLRVQLVFETPEPYYSVTGDGSLMAESDEIEQSTAIFSDIAKAKEQVGPGEYKPLFFTPNAITLSDQVQLVLRFYGEASELHKNYDYVHATNYYDSKEEKVYLIPAAMESLLTKELRYIGSLYPVTSVIRSKKFIKRGWSITAGEYLKMLFQVSELDLTDPQVLREQLTSVDIAYFSILIDGLNNRDMQKHPTIGYAYICTLIDKIFN